MIRALITGRLTPEQASVMETLTLMFVLDGIACAWILRAVQW